MRWRLTDLWPTTAGRPEEKFEEELKKFEKELGVMGKWLAKLRPEMSKKEFKRIMEESEDLGERLGRWAAKPRLMEAVNQKDVRAKLWRRQVTDLMLKFNLVSIRISRWLKGLEVKNKKVLDDKNAKRLFGAVKDLEHNLNYVRKLAKYSLGEREEDIIDNKDVNGVEALGEVRDLIETDFEYEMLGKKIKTQAELMKFVYSAKKEERRAAYGALLDKYKDNVEKLFTVYQAVVKDWGYEARLRGYKSPISMRNFSNQIPDSAVETLLRVCAENKRVFQDFFRFKAKELRVKKLERFDVYAPITEQKPNFRNQKFKEAKEIVLESFGEFSSKFRQEAEKVFEEKHLDSHPRQNKRSGAFCTTISPKITPYVLLNFTGVSRDVRTLAHELGHAVHSLYARKHYPSSQQANLPLAETASTLGEMLVLDKLLKESRDKKKLLTEKMEDTYATILRQNYFIIFEIRAHQLISQGTTPEKLASLYWKTLEEQFGESVEIHPSFRYEWTYISHFFEAPFYCYAYSFGQLLALALYARYKEDKKFGNKIEKILSRGGSKNPETVLKEIGVRMDDGKVWQGSWNIIAQWQKELERV